MNRSRPKIRGSAAIVLMILCGLLPGMVAASGDKICDVAADLALGNEDYPEAILLHRRLLQSHPHNALAHYHLGFAYGMMGLKPKEINEYRTSVGLGLRSWDLFLNLGLAYLDQHQIAQAIHALQTAAELGPEHMETHFNLAIAYESRNRLVDASREIAIAQRLAPTDPDIANMSAIIYAKAGDRQRAHQIWQEIARHAPDYEPAAINLALLNASGFCDSQPSSLSEAPCAPARATYHFAPAR